MKVKELESWLRKYGEEEEVAIAVLSSATLAEHKEHNSLDHANILTSGESKWLDPAHPHIIVLSVPSDS